MFPMCHHVSIETDCTGKPVGVFEQRAGSFGYFMLEMEQGVNYPLFMLFPCCLQ